MMKNKNTILVLASIITFSAIFTGQEILLRLSAFVLFALCIVLGRKEKSIINPYFLFCLTPLTLGCYISISDVFMPELSVKTLQLAVLNIYAFIVALHITPSIRRMRVVDVSSKTEGSLHIIIMLILFSVGLFLPAISAITWFFSVGALIIAIKKRSKVWIGFFCMYLVLRFLSGLASKMEVIMYLIAFVTCYLKYFNKGVKINLKIIVAVLACVFIAVISFQFAAKGKANRIDIDAQYNDYASRVEWNYSTVLFMPYMYLETPWGNLDYVVHTQDTRTHGLWMARPVLGYFGMDDKYEKEYMLEPFSSFNTFTFITVAFKDFGFWLSILSTIFIGFFVKKIYSRFLYSSSSFDVLEYVLVALATFEMFFSNHFYMQSYPFTVFIIMEVYKLVVSMIQSRKFNQKYQTI